jgi:hypothetical protein
MKQNRGIIQPAISLNSFSSEPVPDSLIITDLTKAEYSYIYFSKIWVVDYDNIR